MSDSEARRILDALHAWLDAIEAAKEEFTRKIYEAVRQG